MEIERKFTVKKLPENLEAYPCLIIEQAYLNTNPVIRIRRQDDEYYLTYKGKGLLAREEYNLPLNEQSYYHLRTKADGNIISKKRYVIPIEQPEFTPSYRAAHAFCTEASTASPDLRVELDVFEAPFAPLIIAEVEFPDQEMAEAFVMLDWFSQDVTNDPAYHNSNLSRQIL